MQIGPLSHLNINVMLINLNDRQTLVYRLCRRFTHWLKLFCLFHILISDYYFSHVAGSTSLCFTIFAWKQFWHWKWYQRAKAVHADQCVRIYHEQMYGWPCRPMWNPFFCGSQRTRLPGWWELNDSKQLEKDAQSSICTNHEKQTNGCLLCTYSALKLRLENVPA